MAHLDTYTQPLSSSMVAHLLRRATFGPTQQEIADFTGQSAVQVVDRLIGNSSYRANPPEPIEMEAGRVDSGQPFLEKPYDPSRVFTYYGFLQYWWIGLMTEQLGKPSILEKLTAFWQNHFSMNLTVVEEYRYIYKYIKFLRGNALGSFRDLVFGITKDAAMLIFQNGNENEKEHPNENYGRELQELFTVGQKDFKGNPNYLEQDVKAAARVLTGWQVTNRGKQGTTSFNTIFNPDRHDTTDKVFSAKYGNTNITGRSGVGAGEAELTDLVTMLLAHPETPKFICRKLYRWYVNPNVTQEIEDQVIIPLASFFSSAANNYAVTPVLKKLLTSNIFFDERNIGAIIKSPAELMIGSLRIFDQSVPDMSTEYVPFRTLMNFVNSNMNVQQLSFLNQPSVFGFQPYYQTGYSRNWINGTTLGLRGAGTDSIVYPSLQIKPGYYLGIDILSRLRLIQSNFPDVTNTPGISCEEVLAELSKNLFAIELSQSQKDFLIDNILMMNSSPRTTWVREWNFYRASPGDVSRQNTILWRCRAMLKYMLRMAEYQLF